jgi:hypothetical protein
MLTNRSQIEFRPERFLIKHAEDWFIRGISIEGRPWLTESVRGSMFAAGSKYALPERVLSPGDEVCIDSLYQGAQTAGIAFESCLFGAEGQPKTGGVTRTSGAHAFSVRAESTPTPTSEYVIQQFGRPTRTLDLYQLPLPTRTRDFYPEHLALENAADWVVYDVRINGRSIFLQSGNIPGELFSNASASRSLRLGRLATDDDFVVLATYVGVAPDARLVYELSGPLEPTPGSTAPGVSGFLPMSTGVYILPCTSMQITGRSQLPGYAFRPEQIVIADAEDWVIADVKVGVCSQFANCGDVPGIAFSAQTVGNQLQLSPLHPRCDFTMVVTYIGERAEGAPFYCGVAGNCIRL